MTQTGKQSGVEETDFPFDALMDAPVALSVPDGRTLRFRVRFLAPYAGHTYAVLAHEADDQLLVTTVEPMPDGQVGFTVVGDEDILSAVLEKLAAYSVAQALEREPAQDVDCDCDCHDHAGDDCACGHAHEHHGRCLPDYIKRA